MEKLENKLNEIGVLNMKLLKIKANQIKSKDPHTVQLFLNMDAHQKAFIYVYINNMYNIYILENL